MGLSDAERHALVIKRRKLQREVWLTKELGEELEEPTKHFFVQNRNELLLRLRAWHGQNLFSKNFPLGFCMKLLYRWYIFSFILFFRLP